MASFQKIKTCLTFNKEAEEAVQFYTSIFSNSAVGAVSRYGKAGFEVHGMPEGTAMTVSFTLEGQAFLALNGGPSFRFTEAMSLMVTCRLQDEIDHLWEKLSAGSDETTHRCGWLKDRYGLWWQIVPEDMGRLMTSKEPGKAQRVMQAMLQMKKLEIQVLEEA